MTSENKQKRINTTLAIGGFRQSVSLGMHHGRDTRLPTGLFMHINFALQSMGINQQITFDLNRQSAGELAGTAVSEARESSRESDS
jgi:hypothetical protein